MNNQGLTNTSMSSPGQRIQESEASEQSNTSKFLNNIKSEMQILKIQQHTEQELHQKRVQDMRKELEYLKSTEWKYQAVDRLGQNYRY